jgi:hypothetical protein
MRRKDVEKTTNDVTKNKNSNQQKLAISKELQTTNHKIQTDLQLKTNINNNRSVIITFFPQ